MTEERIRREEEELRKRLIREAVEAAVADFKVSLEQMLRPLERKRKRKQLGKTCNETKQREGL